MSTSAEALALDNNRKPAWLDRFARRRAHRRLRSFKHGRIVLRDPLGVTHWGDDNGVEVCIDVHDLRFYRDLALGGSLGAARSYMDGNWSCDTLTDLFRLFIHNSEETDRLDGGLARAAAAAEAWRHRRNANSSQGARRNVHAHYDLGNDLFALFLDETMTYSAGIFADQDTTLREASIAKLDRICRKLGLGPSDHVLEIGAGWGSFAIHAARRYGCRVTTTTISREQFELAQQRIAAAGVAGRVELLLRDYRELDGEFDKLVSIEMIEAVGHDFLPVFFGQCARLLKPEGQMLLQGISMPDRRYRQYLKNSDFIRRYVFPGSCCPSISAMLDALRTATDLKLDHLEDIGPHYATTLRHWRQRFLAREDEVLRLGYPPRFVRMWVYYLCYCEAGFEERYLGDVQLHLIKPKCRTQAILGELGAPHDRK